MIRPIMKDVFFLSQKSEPATIADKQVGQDLLDTLAAHTHECVGMAANMIGIRKNIIVVNMGFVNLVMFNPKITKKSGKYETEEGCLSLIGVRPCTRYKEITVEYEDMNFKKQKITLKDWPAQICQHEIDHLAGIII
ncbi:MAG: peptide deformylase [Lachnospiraceae bacterium]|nr:peptide deformylase [Lachnospiraceae bacterium]